MTFLKNLFSFLVGATAVLLWKIAKDINGGRNVLESNHVLVIGVLSARDHFEQRQAIRDTWMTLLNSSLSSRILLKFIVGSPCTIPVPDRLDKYGCVPWLPKLPASAQDELTLFEITDKHKGALLPSLSASISLVTSQQIVVGALGILEELVRNSTRPIMVKLLDGISLTVVTSATFSSGNAGVVQGGYLYKPVESYILPKGYEAALEVDVDVSNYAHISPVYVTYNNYGLVQLRGVMLNNTLQVFTPVMSMVYTLKDEQEFQNVSSHLEGQEMRLAQHTENLVAEKTTLHREIEQHHDIVIVDTVDVYRNLPQKVLEFLKWLRANNISYEYLLKTDDDCYVNVDAIVNFITSLSNERKIWLGNFRYDWKVEPYGKWAEHKYTALSYPKFACGVGYVLSLDLAEWISSNSDHLEIFQGEDVSMGIWLSAVGPRYIQHDGLLCEKSCTQDLLAIPELTPSEMIDMWNNVLECANPCGCNAELLDLG